MQYLLLCQSLTYAQRAAKLLERKGITASVVKAPKEAAVHGCSYCVRVSDRVKDSALQLLEAAALTPERVFHISNGTLSEVTL